LQQSADAEEGQAKGRYNEGLKGAIQNYFKTREGVPEQLQQGQGPLANPDDLQVDPAVKADPRKAMVEALTSQYAPLQELGKAEMSASSKQQMSQKDMYGLASHYTPDSVNAFVQTGDNRVLKPIQKTHVVNGQLVRESGDGAAPMGDFRDKYTNPAMMNGAAGPVLSQTNAATGELKTFGSPLVQIDNSQNKGADALVQKLAGVNVDNLSASRDKAAGAAELLTTMQNAKQLLPKATTGFGAEARLSLQKMAALVGLSDPEAISSSEQLGATLAQNILSNVAKLKGAISDKEMPFLEKVAGGTLKSDPATLERVLNLGIAASINAVRDHQKMLTQFRQQKGATPEMTAMYEVPEPGFSLGDGKFGMDEGTGKFYVEPNVGTQAQKPKQKWNASHVAELESLKQHFGVK
jgi:hypothetical protein